MEDQKQIIEALKIKHNCDIFTLTVKNKDGQEITVLLKDLNDRVLYKSVSVLIEKDELLGAESLIKNLWVGGDDYKKITEDFKALRSAAVSIIPIVKVEAGELKKN